MDVIPPIDLPSLLTTVRKLNAETPTHIATMNRMRDVAQKTQDALTKIDPKK